MDSIKYKFRSTACLLLKSNDLFNICFIIIYNHYNFSRFFKQYKAMNDNGS